MTNPIPDDPETIAQFAPGQRMFDRDGDDSELVVAEIRRTPAHEEVISEIGKTVAKVNPDYPAHEPVVEVAFVADIQDALGTTWNDDDIPEMSNDDTLESEGVTTYTYPVGRLVPFKEVEEADR
jgi:hypothetical protein